MRKKNHGPKNPALVNPRFCEVGRLFHALLPAAGSAFTNGPAGHEFVRDPPWITMGSFLPGKKRGRKGSIASMSEAPIKLMF